jgi:hypothetical protein
VTTTVAHESNAIDVAEPIVAPVAALLGGHPRCVALLT